MTSISEYDEDSGEFDEHANEDLVKLRVISCNVFKKITILLLFNL